MQKLTSLAGFLLFSISLFAQTIHSPNGKLSLTFALNPAGAPTYRPFF